MSYGRPGVYIRERSLPAPIAPNSLSNAVGAALGQFASGPESPVLIRSWFEFVRRFGGYNTSYPATFGVGQFFRNGGTSLYVRRVLGADADAAAVTIPGATSGTVGTVTAKSKGSDGNKLRVKFTAAATANYYTLDVYLEQGVDPDSTADDELVESYSNVVLNDPDSSDYIVTVVGEESEYITVAIADGTIAPSVALLPLVGGDDGTAATDTEFIAALEDFDSITQPLVLFAPEVIKDLGDTDGQLVQEALISWANTNAGFAVLDTEPGLTVSQAKDYATALGSSANAAVYYPNIYIPDPLGRNSSSRRRVGPAASVAGLYLSTDLQFGPFKSPAGLRSSLAGAVAIERQFTNAELDELNSTAFPLNAIRDIPGAGVVVMGARTLKQDGTANRYVATRRSLLYIRKRMEEIAQFALFEANDERLWGRLRTSIGVFLNEYRNQGGLRGDTPDLAFFVKCDAETNPPQAIANGEVNIQVGVALEYPAEFIVITLSQKTGE
jgi:hypothetical protein